MGCKSIIFSFKPVLCDGFSPVFRGGFKLSLAGYVAGFFTVALAGCIESGGASHDGVSRLGDDVVAEVSGTKIYHSDVLRAAESGQLLEDGNALDLRAPETIKLTAELIDQRLLLLAALAQGLDQTDEGKRRLSASRERILSALLIEQRLKESVTEAAVREIYDAQAALRAGGDEIRARQILAQTEDGIKKAAKALAGGADFAELAAELSIDRASKDIGGDLGYFTADMLAAEFSDAVFSLPKGKISAPFKTSYGWHIVEVTGRRAAQSASFESMQGQLMQYLTYEEVEKLINSLRDTADIKVLTKSGHSDMQESDLQSPSKIDE